MMRKQILWAGLLWAILGAWTSVAAPAGVPPFADGDRVCFIGDSITHQARYHTQIVLFYTTRFPQMRLTAWNCGFAGDTAGGALKRHAWDIAAHRPTVVTLMLGMNDVNRGLYAAGKSGPEVDQQRQEAIARRNANLEQLAARLAQDGVRMIFLTPSLFDQTGNQSTERLVGVNDALQACAAADRKLAQRYAAGLVDLNGPLAALNRAGQAQDPNFTIVGPDRVHPGPVGHLVMAYLFLKAQGLSPCVAAIEIDAARRQVVRQDNCRVEQFSATAGELAFTALAEALPFPVEAESQTALKLVPFTDDLNQETLRVCGLPAGSYQLSIDECPIVTTTAAALAGGINLATLAQTPQYRQATVVQRLMAERAHLEGRKLRTLDQVRFLFFDDLAARTPEAEQKVLANFLEQTRDSTSTWNRYRRGLIETYQQVLREKEQLQRHSAELLAQIEAAKIPQPHRYRLQRTGDVAPTAGSR